MASAKTPQTNELLRVPYQNEDSRNSSFQLKSCFASTRNRRETKRNDSETFTLVHAFTPAFAAAFSAGIGFFSNTCPNFRNLAYLCLRRSLGDIANSCSSCLS